MQRTMLKSKIHPELLDGADIREFEQVAVVDVDNSARFHTYTIADELDNYSPRVVHVDARNEILNIDREVATLLRASTVA
jgi:aspartate 1-decarboxylase